MKHPAFALELGAFGGGFLERLRTRGMTARVRQRAIEQEPDLNGVSRVGKLGIDRLMQFPEPPDPLIRHRVILPLVSFRQQQRRPAAGS